MGSERPLPEQPEGNTGQLPPPTPSPAVTRALLVMPPPLDGPPAEGLVNADMMPFNQSIDEANEFERNHRSEINASSSVSSEFSEGGNQREQLSDPWAAQK